ncbi:hypothetical protein B4077_1566 [Bacillus cereus]|uniref:Uncharacterized protein n=1 Tax=Bacillus cereus TaxID=1396 RepID=A0A0G8EZS6_BACCE|nr:hypothetical protein bcere0006_17180 [Bacillus wiedmannii]KLA29823.1 hypothetical protein B4077_1566 [Bacillus cereus]
MAAFICNVVNGEYYFYKSLNNKRELSCRKSLQGENIFDEKWVDLMYYIVVSKG